MDKTENIIFDFGGVLIDWNPEYLYRKVFATEEEMRRFLTDVCRYEWNVLQDAGRPLAEGTRLLRQQYPEYREEIAMYYGRWDEMLGGVIEENARLVKPLKAKYKVYGLTNWSGETIPIAMERYDFFKELDGMVVSGIEKCIKPDERIYHILLDRYRLQPENSLFIDDNLANVETARRLGMQAIHLGEAVNLEKELVRRGIL